MNKNLFNEVEITKNRVKELILKMGFKPEPTDEKLKELFLTRHRFTKILENNVELTSSELVNIANWLKVDIKELFEVQKDILSQQY